MVERRITYFDLGQIARSGQCFRMDRLDECRYGVTASDQYVEIWQKGELVRFFCDQTTFEKVWSPYFDLETDYGQFAARISRRDHFLAEAARYGSGIRILRQDLWEVMVTFLISQNNHMKRIRQCVERLCTHFGQEKTAPSGKRYYAMPGPEALADPEGLKTMGLGYRDKYIAALAAGILDGTVSLDHLRGLKSRKRTHEMLITLSGVGDKVADCIQLFGLHQMGTFPVDTWMKKVLCRYYPNGFPLRRYQDCAGLMQQYLFFYVTETDVL